MKPIKTKAILLLVIAALFAFSLPVYAADEAQNLEISLKPGSGQMKVNGETVKVEPPYQTQGTTMVPLSVITKAFGAKLSLKNNKVITLTYSKHVVVLTIGSKTATVNGKKIELAVAPVIRNNVTMVPLRVIAEAFGAKLQIDKSSKAITISGKLASGAGGAGNGSQIDPDAGKTRIGDSFYKWSMNYPAGLVQQTAYGVNDKRIIFTDIKDEYYLSINISKAEDELDSEERLEWLRSYVSYNVKVLDVQPAKAAAGYDRIVGKNTSGFFYEYRGFQENGYYYGIVFGKKAKSAKELESHAALLNSFRTSFNVNDKTIKDLSLRKTEKVPFKYADYGLTVDLPANWESVGTEATFYGPDGEYLSVDAYSLKEGDTLASLVQREIDYTNAMYAKEYMKELTFTDVTWNGVPAKLVKFAYSFDKKEWWESHGIIAIKGEFKYHAMFGYPQEEAGTLAPLAEEALLGMKLSFSKVEGYFGNVPDPYDSIDLTTTVTKTSKEYGYSITVPKHWVSGPLDMEESDVEVGSEFVSVGISIEKGTLKESLEMFEEESEYKKDSQTEVTFAGVPAIRLELTVPYSSYELPGSMIVYMFEKDGQVYRIGSILPDVNASELNINQLEAALNSFVLTK